MLQTANLSPLFYNHFVTNQISWTSTSQIPPANKPDFVKTPVNFILPTPMITFIYSSYYIFQVPLLHLTVLFFFKLFFLPTILSHFPFFPLFCILGYLTIYSPGAIPSTTIATPFLLSIHWLHHHFHMTFSRTPSNLHSLLGCLIYFAIIEHIYNVTSHIHISGVNLTLEIQICLSLCLNDKKTS